MNKALISTITDQHNMHWFQYYCMIFQGIYSDNATGQYAGVQSCNHIPIEKHEPAAGSH